MILSLFVGFVLGAAAILFALQNNEIVALTFLGWQFESSLALLVLVALATGVLISVLVSIPSAVAGALRISGLKRENRRLAEQVDLHQKTIRANGATVGTPVLDIRS